jgi:tRNA 2-selenouridine synthase
VRAVVLTGLAGVGKTELLTRLAAAGEQVLDLERLAAHRGSSFGRIGIDAPQPTESEFHARIRHALATYGRDRPVWMEDEGPHIGSMWLPREVAEAIAAAETVCITVPFDERVGRLVDTYGRADPTELIAAVQRIRRRLGNSRTDRAISHFHAGRPDAAIRVLLEYFDEGYTRRAERDTRPALPCDELPAVIRGRASPNDARVSA